jgi:hypothetical protein
MRSSLHKKKQKKRIPKRALRGPVCLIFLFIAVLFACGELRYCRTAADTENFHPTRVGLFPVDVGVYSDAKGVIDNIVSDVVIDKEWFSGVVVPNTIKDRLAADESLAGAVETYFAKLDIVHFSDPELSGQIGRAYNIDAFLLTKVDFWDLTPGENGKVSAKAGLSMRLIRADDGSIVWEARHFETKDYWLIKPDLSEIARKVADSMVKYMPH